MEKIKINMGCGWRDFGDGWISIDGGDYPHLNHKDVTKLPYGDNTVDLIYSSHLIAYFDRQEIVPIFNEWKRVLKPNGILRIATPDFQSMSDLCAYDNIALDAFLGPIFGKMPMGQETIYHKTIYDFDSLSKILKEIGFNDIKKYDWRNTEHAGFDDHSKAHYPHDKQAIDLGVFTDKHTLLSLNIEATK